jgi:hypothetical protein
MYLRVNFKQNWFDQEQQLFLILKFALSQIIEELNTYTIIKLQHPVALHISEFTLRYA